MMLGVLVFPAVTAKLLRLVLFEFQNVKNKKPGGFLKRIHSVSQESLPGFIKTRGEIRPQYATKKLK
jgi:hypothetical protein